MFLKLIDHTDRMVYLAIELFEKLNGLDKKVRIVIEKAAAQEYNSFFELFRNIEFIVSDGRYDKPDPTIQFIDSIGSISSPLDQKSLFYPILNDTPRNADQTADIFFEGIEQGQIVPLGASRGFAGQFIADPDSAIDMLSRLGSKQDLLGKRVLISAGPTAEDIDPVRYLTNRSSGKMGLALARAAWIRGAHVNLVLGATALHVPVHIPLERVRSAQQMAETIIEKFKNSDVYIASAAVADFTPQKFLKDKIKKQPSGLELNLIRTTDILKALNKDRDEQLLVGFSLETRDELKNSMAKLDSKKLDFIVINNPGDKGAAFASETNLVTILSPNGQAVKLPLMSKLDISNRIFDKIINIWQKDTPGRI